jgi:hypothetical protein
MRALSILMLCFLTGGCAHADLPRPITSNPSAADQEAAARHFVEQLARHEFAPAAAIFDEAIGKAVPVERLEKLWTGLETRWGTLVDIEGVRGEPYGKGWGVLVTCRFARDVHTLSVGVGVDGRIDSMALSSPVPFIGRMFIYSLGHRQPEIAAALSDAQMHEVAPAEKLAKVWAELEDKFGAYERVAEATDHGLFARVIVAFGHTFATFTVGVNPRGQVTGIHVVEVGKAPTPAVKPAPTEPQLDFDRQSG